MCKGDFYLFNFSILTDESFSECLRQNLKQKLIQRASYFFLKIVHKLKMLKKMVSRQ